MILQRLKLLILGFAIFGPASAQAIRDSATVPSDGALHGGAKEWLLFENSAHDAYVQETDRFAREVTRFLRSGS